MEVRVIFVSACGDDCEQTIIDFIESCAINLIGTALKERSRRGFRRLLLNLGGNRKVEHSQGYSLLSCIVKLL